jgi:hypothetical protein
LAQKCDTTGQLHEALHFYTLTLQALNNAIASEREKKNDLFSSSHHAFSPPVDTSETRKEVTTKKCVEYGARKAQIEARIQDGQASGATPPMPALRQSINENWSAAPGSPHIGNNHGGDDAPGPHARSLPPKPLPSAPGNGNALLAQAQSMPVVHPTIAFGSSQDAFPPETYSEGMLNGGPARPAGPAATIGLGTSQSPQAYNADNAYKVLALWVTDAPVHSRLQQLRDAGHDVLMTQTFAEGMKVLRRNTNITHIVNNMHRAGGKLAATTELISLVNKYDDTLPIILTTFEDEKKKGKKRGGISDADFNTCMQMGAKTSVHSMDELLQALKELARPAQKGANLGPPPLNPQARNWGKSVFNTNGLEYYIGDKIGGGNFGIIYDCKDVFGQDYVCKILKTNRPEEEVQADWAKETQFLFTLNHPNIVQLYDAFCFNNLYHMILERCSGSMRDYVDRHGPLSGPDVVSVGGMILAGLHHIHLRNIIHRDLHVDNILYAPPRTPNQKLCIKISDFGISKLLRPTENAAVTFIGRDYDYCVRERDHQILTSRGFLFLDEVEALVDRDAATGAVRDWRGLRVANYDAKTRRLVYEQPRALVVNERRGTFLEFTADSARARWSAKPAAAAAAAARCDVSIAVTPEHEMYVARGDSFKKMSAAQLAAQLAAGGGSVSLRLLTAAAGGVEASTSLGSARRRPAAAAPPAALLELFGFVRLGGGSPNASYAAARLQQLDDAASAALAPLASREWLWALSSDALRHVVAGAALAPCVTGDAALRDDLVRVALHAGFSAHFVAANAAATQWRVLIDRDAADVRFGGAAAAAETLCVREVAADSRSWCFDMRDGFIVTRRALRAADGVVTQASQPTIQGNCPELVTKGHTTKRSDIYQLGLVLYHIYTGQHALSANDGNNVVQIVTSGLARSRAEQLNTKLGDVIAIMLRRAPEYRYKDCVETAAHLFAILEN